MVPSPYSLLFVLWVFAAVLPILLLFIAGVVTAGAGRRARFFALTLFVMATACVSCIKAHPLWFSRQVAIRWRAARPCIEGLVGKLEIGALPYEPMEPATAACGKYRVFPGPPLRVAIDWPGGHMDKPEAIVYDPSGELLRAREGYGDFDLQKHPSVTPIVEAYAQRLGGCTPLDGPYVHCVFGY
jgi:hypothetical protein